MKKRVTLIIGVILFFASPLFSQVDVKTVDMAEINRAKQEGRLTGKEQYVNFDALGKNPARVAENRPPAHAGGGSNGCNCWVQRDSTWQVAQFDGSGGSGGPGLPPDYRNDDWSTVAIPLGFPFAFYDVQLYEVYINNNGNVSLGSPYATFTANSFPDATYSMIAPFWADVDTRGPLSGIVYYQLTNSHLIVQWENVGYFSQHDSLGNTFQLILTNGWDPLLPPGQNVSFCYQDMQWTTGDASGGSGGFGGTPATVGVNQGNGTDYIQIGLFDQPGASYDGPYGNNDGIDALDYQSFVFNLAQSGTNAPPILNSAQACDTITVCAGDTVLIEGVFLSPEQGQITTVSTSTTMGGVTVTSLPGNTANFTVQVVAQSADVGLNNLMIIATDDGTPVGASQFPVVINIQPAPVATVTSTNVSCNGADDGTASLNITGTGPFDILWSPGGYQTASVSNLAAGTYTVDISIPAGCSTTNQVTITEPPALTITTVAQDVNCSGQSGSVVCTVGGGTGPYSYLWNTTPPQTTSQITNLSAGTYTVDVTDANNCTISATAEVNGLAGFSTSMSTTPATCLASDGTASVQTTGGSGNFSYSWNPNVSTGATATGLAAGMYEVTITDNADGCQQIVTGTVANSAGIVASIVSSTGATCQNGEDGSATASGSGGTAPYSYLWMPNGDTTATVNNLTPGTYTVQVSDYDGCPDFATVTIGYLNPAPVVDLGPDTTICLGATLTLDAGAGYQYLWSDNSTNQTLDVTAAGSYSVLVTDANSCEAFDAINVSTVVCARNTFGTTQQARRSFGIYPNPSTGVVDINFSNETAADVQVDVVDVYGKSLFHASENLKAHDLRKYDLSHLSSGIYFVRISYGAETRSIRLIKQ